MVPAETDYGVRMELAELSRRFTPKVLNKQIRGQRMLPTNDRTSFEYGAFEKNLSLQEVSACVLGWRVFGRCIPIPREGLAWIKSTELDAFFWEVRRQDLDGNYSELEENR